MRQSTRARLGKMRNIWGVGTLVLGTVWIAQVQAGGVQTLDTLVIEGGESGEVAGTAESATVGTVTAEQLRTRPILRPGELLEVVPGLVVTQHSGEGKANQYFLRGFNLDHGTDLATTLDGMPVNMPTHGHGQGWTDINFLIPELVDTIQYKKGPYYAEEGDFSAAGAVQIRYANKVDRALVTSAGQYGYYRVLAANSPEVGAGRLLYAAELTADNGPWDNPQGMRKNNVVLRYSAGSLTNGYNLSVMGYEADWTAADQVPLRAIDSGQIDRYGYIDPTVGGTTHRDSISGSWWKNDVSSSLKANVYAIKYDLDLFSNFTYFLEDPVNGDQFEQVDDRWVYGAKSAYQWVTPLLGRDMENEVGVQLRYDNIGHVGLYHTSERQRVSTVRSDAVKQGSYAVYAKNDVRWTPWLRSILGLRADYYTFNVDSNLDANSGTASDSVISPKLSMVLGPWAKTEYFLNVGKGFHSNDGRGSTITVDPTDGVTAADKVDPLVDAVGVDLGMRSTIIPKVQTSLALWALDIGSELLFVGDGGSTEASRPSRRMGVEGAVYYRPMKWLILDADAAMTHARFKDSAPEGDYVPGSIESVVSMGLAVDRPTGVFGGMRLRYFGPRPLIEDNSHRSDATLLVNGDVGYKVNKNLELALEIINLLNNNGSDIDYWYESQLKTEATPEEGIHFHPISPRMVRASLSARF